MSATTARRSLARIWSGDMPRNIGEMVKLIKDRTPESDLLNGPHKLCECGQTPGSCCSPVPRNPDRKPGV